MGLQPIGTPQTARLPFNSGYVTLGSGQVINIQDISVNLGFDVKDLKALNSIKKQTNRRANFVVECTFNAAGNQSLMSGLFFSSSSPSGSGTDYTIKDGQQAATTFYVTGHVDDDPTKAIQFQIANAIISKNDHSKAMEAFEMVSYTVVGTDVTMYEATLAAS